MDNDTLNDFIAGIPKAELHLHIEGTFEPELLFHIAYRNKVGLVHQSVEELRNAYNFNNLQEFLDIYYEGADVLISEQDFYDLTLAYLQKAYEQNIVHAEIFFDPQTHTQRGVSFETVVKGIQKALDEAHDNWGITTRLIPNFLRHLSEEEAIETFREAMEFGELFYAFGLDSSENGHPPGKFKKVFDMVREEGFLVVTHAGEEGPAQYVWDALKLLGASRIDHGIRSVDDEALMQELAFRKIPLTVCPLSNLKLKVVRNMKELPLPALLEKEILVTINSDDPAYFGGYVNKNYQAIADAFNLTKDDILMLAHNSFTASFLDDHTKDHWHRVLKDYYKKHK
ncbi:MAG: adenosine deaminase [Bacteroidota bacterium]